MNELDRFGDVYKQGVVDFIQFATVNNRGSTTCPCLCRECQNGKSFVFGTISRHLISYGMDKNYRVWVLHGKNPCTDQVVEPVIEEENTEAEGLGMGNFVDASYGVHEVVAGDLNEDEENHMGDFELPPVFEPDLGKRYNEYKNMAEQKLYPSCEAPVTTFSAIVDLHNLKKKYALEAMAEQVKPDHMASHIANAASTKQDKNATKTRGSGSPFKCIGLGLTQQINSEKNEELTARRLRIEELEAEVVFMLHAILATAESMTHDVIRDLLGVKLDMTNYASLLDNQQVQKITKKAQVYSESPFMPFSIEEQPL
ncbi:hypothetical protein IFM89_010837 [Coptis chinensis]|uniref:Transposase-associated domain-containing protein n=1 Tax=Coptis chinensis TaxID=261450 RepID=A0A835HXE1_9MAGN|nr:hypothetical protein IFM89_010837 [Coptis chinensis]